METNMEDAKYFLKRLRYNITVFSVWKALKWSMEDLRWHRVRCALCSKRLFGHIISNYTGSIPSEEGNYSVCMQCYDWMKNKHIENKMVHLSGEKQ